LLAFLIWPIIRRQQINHVMKNIDFEKGENGRRAIQEKYNWQLDFSRIEKEIERLDWTV